jgi:mannosyltransferase
MCCVVVCRFWNSEIFKVPEVAAVDYIMRMDTDALILSEFSSDPFAAMEGQGAVYGYKCVMPDFPPFVRGIVPFVQKYLHKHQLRPLFPSFGDWLTKASITSRTAKDGEERVPMMYTNMEIMSTKFFTSDPVQAFLNAVDQSFDIYRYRWGDAPLRAMVLGTFATKVCVTQEESRTYNTGYTYGYRLTPCITKCSM